MKFNRVPLEEIKFTNKTQNILDKYDEEYERELKEMEEEFGPLGRSIVD